MNRFPADRCSACVANSLFAAVLCCFTMGFSTIGLSESGIAAEQPDVLFIAVDDLNDWTSHLGGHPQTRTPNIDRLVARGTLFTNAHCAAPACNPSRAALMSGIRPWMSGVYTNGDPAQSVLKNTMTLNRHLKAHGYQVYGGGKIYHGFSSEGRNDTWDEWRGLFSTAGGQELNLNGLKRGHFDWGPIDAVAQDMGDYKLTDWAIDKLQHPSDAPMFLAVGYVKPHLPWYVPQEYYDRFPLKSIELPVVTQSDLADIPAAGKQMAKPEGDHAVVVKANQWHKAVQAYLATISFLDDQVGRLLAGLESSPRGKSTIVVWWTDHGWHLGEKEHWRKFALWEEATRTSMAISVPGMTKPGSMCAAPVDYTSMYPTLCELLKLPVPEQAQGPSLVPLLKDVSANWDHVAVCTHGRGNHAARDSRFRYIRYRNGDEELYDHEVDPNEWSNLADRAEFAAVKRRLALAMPRIEQEVPATSDRGNGKVGTNAKKEKANKPAED
jgi:arylsulfatase A-like enzyme